MKHGLIITADDENYANKLNCPRLFSFSSLDSRYSLDVYLSENQLLEIKFTDNKKKHFVYQTLCDVFIEQQQSYKLEIYFFAETGKLSVKLNDRNPFAPEESFSSVIERFSTFRYKLFIEIVII